MSREVCKYFLHGACRNGASCRFVHSTDAPKSTVCTFYLQGNCAYGDRCRYDHVRPQGNNGGQPGPSYGGVPYQAGMTAGARPFVPGGGRGGQSWQQPYYPQCPPVPPGAPPGGRGWNNHAPLAAQLRGQEQYPGAQNEGEDEEGWGYVDENGNWVSFDEGDDETEFLKAQLPSEDDLLDLGISSTDGAPGADGGAEDEWGYYDDNGDWVAFGGEADKFLTNANKNSAEV